MYGCRLALLRSPHSQVRWRCGYTDRTAEEMNLPPDGLNRWHISIPRSPALAFNCAFRSLRLLLLLLDFAAFAVGSESPEPISPITTHSHLAEPKLFSSNARAEDISRDRESQRRRCSRLAAQSELIGGRAKMRMFGRCAAIERLRT